MLFSEFSIQYLLWISYSVNCICWNLSKVFLWLHRQYFSESVNIIISAIKWEWWQQCLPGMTWDIWMRLAGSLFTSISLILPTVFLLSSQLYFLSFVKYISSFFFLSTVVYILASSHHHQCSQVGIPTRDDTRHLNAVDQFIIGLYFSYSTKYISLNLSNVFL